MKKQDKEITIKIDIEVFEKLKEIAIPFIDTTPNLVIRRLLGLGSKKLAGNKEGASFIKASRKITQKTSVATPEYNGGPSNDIAIEELRVKSSFAHPAFLTFLMDKFYNSHGNYSTSGIIPFMGKMKMQTISGGYRNPWMKAPYGGEKNGRNSCIRTIEHFRQTRKFGCWGGKNIKANCDANDYCIYHPGNPDVIKNKCDLRKGAIWKRENPDSPFTYGANYLEVIKQELLSNKEMPLEPLLSVFYSNEILNPNLVSKFKEDFNLNESEMELFSYTL